MKSSKRSFLGLEFMISLVYATAGTCLIPQLLLTDGSCKCIFFSNCFIGIIQIL